MRFSPRGVFTLVLGGLGALFTVLRGPNPQLSETLLLLTLLGAVLEVRSVPGTRHGPFSCAATFYLAGALTAGVGPSGALVCCFLALLLRLVLGPGPKLVETYFADFASVSLACAACSGLAGSRWSSTVFGTFLAYLIASEVLSSLLYPLHKHTRLTRTRFALASVVGALPTAYLAGQMPLLTLSLGALMLIVQNGSYMRIRQEALAESVRNLQSTKKDLARAQKETSATSHRLEHTAKERDLVENLAQYFASNPSEEQVLAGCLEAVESLFPKSIKSLWRATADGFSLWHTGSPSSAELEPALLEKCWRLQKACTYPGEGHTNVLVPLPEEGVLAVRIPENMEASQRRRDLLTILASQFALGLQSARFRGQLQQALLLQKQTNQKLQESQAQLVQSGKMAAVGQLAAGVAHELNSPLAAALLQIQLGKMRLESESYQKLATSLETAELSLSLAQEIIEKLLSFSRASQSETSPVDLAKVVQAAWELVRDQFEAEQIQVELKLSQELLVQGAVTELQQVFINLLLNARYACLQTVQEREAKITIEAFSRPGRATVVVSDTGPGVPPEAAARIFEPFFTTKPIGEGTGLGLSISFEIVKAHGGTLEMKTSPDGARFRVVLPLLAPNNSC